MTFEAKSVQRRLTFGQPFQDSWNCLYSVSFSDEGTVPRDPSSSLSLAKQPGQRGRRGRGWRQRSPGHPRDPSTVFLYRGTSFSFQPLSQKPSPDSGPGRVQGYLTYKKTQPPRTLPSAYAWSPKGVLGGRAFFIWARYPCQAFRVPSRATCPLNATWGCRHAGSCSDFVSQSRLCQ